MATKFDEQTYSEKYFNIDGTPATFLHGWKPQRGEHIVYVTEAENYCVVLGELGFYVVSVVPNDPSAFVSDWIYSKFQAIALADKKEAGE